MSKKRSIPPRIVFILIFAMIFLGISLVIVYPGLKQMKEAERWLIETSKKEVFPKKPAHQVITPTSPLPESNDELPVEGDSTIKDVPLPKSEMLEDEDISIETGEEDEEVEAEVPSEENPISPKDRKLLE